MYPMEKGGSVNKAGVVLAAARKASSMSQSEMAKALGISVVSVSHWENGHTAMTLDKMQRWYAALSEDGRKVMRSLNVFELGA
jgi:transcriptional regulator with XRE-family HTH domain